MLKRIDEYFFGTSEEQKGYYQKEKLWFYGSFASIVAICIFVKIVAV